MISIKCCIYNSLSKHLIQQYIKQHYTSQSHWLLMISNQLLFCCCMCIMTTCLCISSSVFSAIASVKQNVLVLRVGNLIPALQSSYCFPHMFRLEWWCVSPLLTDIQCCSRKQEYMCIYIYIFFAHLKLFGLKSLKLCYFVTHLPQQFPLQILLKYQTWQ